MIDQVEGRAVTSVAEFTQIIRGLKPEDGIHVHIVRPSIENPTALEVVLKP